VEKSLSLVAKPLSAAQNRGHTVAWPPDFIVKYTIYAELEKLPARVHP
jgi:hypothetical protein